MMLDEVIEVYKNSIEKMQRSGYQEFIEVIKFQETVVSLLEELQEYRSRIP